MKISSWLIGVFSGLGLMFTGCGDDGGGGGVIGQGANRAGPEALSGFSWGSSLTSNGIDFDFMFEFGDTTIVATNTCTVGGDVLTAEVEAPVTYRYRATITEDGQAGDESCNVYAAKSAIDFTISGNTLTGVSGGQTLIFTSTGARSGVYGDWTSSIDGFTLTWSITSNRLNVRSDCGNGKSVKLSVAAKLENFVDIKEAKEQTVGDESFECSVSVQAGTVTYHFDGKTLVMLFGGEEIRFSSE